MFTLKTPRKSEFEVNDVSDVELVGVVWGTWIDSGVQNSCMVADLLDPEGLIDKAVKELGDG